MKLLRFLFVLLGLFGLGSAHAGYALATPPSGFAGTAPGAMFWNRTASNAPWVGGSAAANVTVNVGGRAVTVPASMRLAANAASYATAAIRLNPAALATGAIATWALGFGLEYVAGQWMKPGQPTVQCRLNGIGAYSSCEAVRQAQIAAKQAAGCGGDTCVVIFAQWHNQEAGTWGNVAVHTVNQFRIGGLNQAAVDYYGASESGCAAANCFQSISAQSVTAPGEAAPATEVDWQAPTNATTLPDGVANQLPGVPLPVQRPVINPDTSGNPMPFRVPEGVPVPVPGTSPQQWQQPVSDVIPLVWGDPWGVDVQPKLVPSPDAVGQTQPLNDPATVGTPLQKIEVETCGLPGKPPCKIDETGTPDGSTLVAKLTQITAAGDSVKAAVDDVSKPTDFGWSFGVLLPDASCSALQFYKPGGTWGVDICNSPIVNWLRTLMAWAFAVWTAVYVWRRATAAVAGEKE